MGPTAVLTAWGNFYVIAGSSGAALTGLQFVVIALVAETASRQSSREIAAFGTMRVFPKEVTDDDDFLYVDGHKIAMTAERDPAQIPWGKLGVDIVVESTGVFTKKEQLQKHIQGGAKKVILTVPASDEIDATIVIGVNDDTLKPEHKLVSNASCTTNCLAPIAKILHEHFGIEEGFVTR